ncbi:MAG: hypothetical protein WBP81_21690 [Solirubrobacteraceae bacterium]
MPPRSDATDKQQVGYSTSKQQRMYRELRERTERQQRRREQFIERLRQHQRERRLYSLRRPSRAVESAVTESIEGPAPAEDSSVPPDPSRAPIDT